MSAKSHLEILFAYHWHTTGHLMECAAKLSDADYKQIPGYGQGSVHDLLFHVLHADVLWRVAFETGQISWPLHKEDFPALSSLQNAFRSEQLAWQAILDRLSEEDLESSMHVTSARGFAITVPRWRALQHIVLHGMQHHSELAQLLTAKGQSPGNIDLIFYK